jgi:hypothetical protein
MIEILQIILSLTLFLLFSYFPVNKFTVNKNFLAINKNIPNYIFIIINILLLFLTLLIFSFLKLELNIIFYLLLSFNLLLFFFFFKKVANEILNINFKILKITFVLINIVLFVDMAANFKLGWDAMTLWKIKTNIIFQGGNYIDQINSGFPIYNQYPHLGSYVWAFFWKNSFLQKEYLGRIFYIYIYVVSIFGIALSLQKSNEFKKFLIILLILVLTYKNEYFGFQDYLLFAILNFFFILFNFMRKNLDKIYFPYLLVSLILPWIKNEGIFYLCFITVIYFFYENNSLRKLLLITIVSIPVIFQIMYIKLFYRYDIFQFPLDKNIFFNNFSIQLFINKFFLIIYYIFQSIFKTPLWILNIYFIYISFRERKKIFKDVIPYIIFLTLYLLLLFSVYFLSPFDLVFHLKTSADRLLLQTSGIFFMIFIILNNNSIKLNINRF